MGHDHAAAAVALAPELVQGIAVSRSTSVWRCPPGRCLRKALMGAYPSLKPSSSMSLTNFSQRSPVTWTGD
jgi:hypothetical protein